MPKTIQASMQDSHGSVIKPVEGCSGSSANKTSRHVRQSSETSVSLCIAGLPLLASLPWLCCLLPSPFWPCFPPVGALLWPGQPASAAFLPPVPAAWPPPGDCAPAHSAAASGLVSASNSYVVSGSKQPASAAPSPPLWAAWRPPKAPALTGSAAASGLVSASNSYAISGSKQPASAPLSAAWRPPKAPALAGSAAASGLVSARNTSHTYPFYNPKHGPSDLPCRRSSSFFCA